ncbi:hypothetical protein FGO68_gene14675 [Halteria grandinella]|uniref:Uncharacterized protein n=1 Tax=Halteria grandinella TaxID=5974 RepID=A0A8J8SV04_HALGN|nr:hypothetical protein FGO68_gene14675 [Halteria grandinella]
MRFPLLSVLSLLPLALADISDFPAFDFAHANCAMQATYPQQDCSKIYADMQAVLSQWKEGDPGKGIYAIKETSEERYFWVTRTTPVKKYVDDIAFEFAQACDGCTIKARSRSQTLSYYDYSTNYCNMWNPLTFTGNFTNLEVRDCKFPAEDPAVICNIY